jgi:hypothetical protein
MCMCLFCVASYDSQGYGGGIRTRLHTRPLLGIHSTENTATKNFSVVEWHIKKAGA